MLRTAAPETSARYHRGWGGESRSEIIRHLVVAIDGHEELRPLAYGGATAIREVMAAATAHVTLIVGTLFLDVVNVGDLAADQVVFPDHQYYPLAQYSATAERLLDHRGYLSTDDLGAVDEYVRLSPRPVRPSFMGVPIVAQGTVLGEMFLTRGAGAPPFSAEDLDLALDLATVLGGRIPHVLDADGVPTR